MNRYERGAVARDCDGNMRVLDFWACVERRLRRTGGKGNFHCAPEK